ncbi:glycerate kinase [Rapidithrix thailandica]|uniref:Glycerate kinase n=1 Tax=Rapidithrix thailandica TaxID=413964 RepID=A0AAW9SFQ2_9BACT
MTKILVAPGAFKGSVSAKQASTAIAKGLLYKDPSLEIIELPVSDGGNDFVEVLLHTLSGEELFARVRDPLGHEVRAKWGWCKGELAVIEMAEASGLHLLSPDALNPLKASSFGTGQLLVEALNKGAKKILLGIGGSATVDGGVGALQALGVRFLNQKGVVVNPYEVNLSEVQQVDLQGLDPRLKEISLEIACDVSNPLIGEQGAAKVFAPQKGATNKQVEMLEEGLSHWAELLEKATGKDITKLPGGGAAGGIAAGFVACLEATLSNGIDLVLDAFAFDTIVQQVDWVITGEGSLDRQSLKGKTPVGVARRAKQFEKKVVALAGSVEQTIALNQYFDAVFSIVPGPCTLEDALSFTERNLSFASGQLACFLSSMKK